MKNKKKTVEYSDVDSIYEPAQNRTVIGKIMTLAEKKKPQPATTN